MKSLILAIGVGLAFMNFTFAQETMKPEEIMQKIREKAKKEGVFIPPRHVKAVKECFDKNSAENRQECYEMARRIIDKSIPVQPLRQGSEEALPSN